MFPVSSKYINCRCGLHLKEYQKPDPDNSDRLGIINGNGKFTACHKHEHITKEKYDEIIPQIIDEFMKAGFMETERFFQKDIDINKEYSDLMKDIADIDKISAQKTSKSNQIIRKYMPHIYEVENYKGINTLKLWTEDNIKRTFKSLDKPNYTVNSNFSEFKRSLKFNPVTIYSPIMTKSIVKELDCKTVFDPCIGWGGRMIGTTCLGDDYHYTGSEPFTKTFWGLREMVKDIGLENQVDIYHSPVEDILDKLKDKRFDMCLTSPPYYDLEVYSYEDTQSIQKYKSYDEWINEFIKPIIDFVCKNVDKYSCWSVKNIKTDKKYNLLDDIIQIHEMNGWVLEREFSIKKNTQKNKTTDGDVTYVFVKG
jgi:predicted RNA methylase